MASKPSTTLTLVAAYLGLFVGLIDSNAVNLALPAIRTEFGGGISGAQVSSLTPWAGRFIFWLNAPVVLIGGDGCYEPGRDRHDALSSPGSDVRYELTHTGRQSSIPSASNFPRAEGRSSATAWTGPSSATTCPARWVVRSSTGCCPRTGCGGCRSTVR
jgi:hypothetical protein